MNEQIFGSAAVQKKLEAIDEYKLERTELYKYWFWIGRQARRMCLLENPCSKELKES